MYQGSLSIVFNIVFNAIRKPVIRMPESMQLADTTQAVIQEISLLPNEDGIFDGVEPRDLRPRSGIRQAREETLPVASLGLTPPCRRRIVGHAEDTMLVTCREMAEAEARLFSGGASAEPYMDEAGRLCAEAVLQFFPRPARAAIFCGKGNNGGDALVVARWLKRAGWEVALRFSHGREGLSPLAARKLEQYEAEPPPAASAVRRAGRRVLVDGLLGIGASGDLRGGILELAEEIARLRREEGAACFAIDIPTGLDADTGRAGAGAVEADFTLSITAAKPGFVADAALPYLGRLVEIPLDIPLGGGGDASRRFLFPSNLRSRLARRSFGCHKGDAGRVVLVAGSRGLTGAAALAAAGASSGGAGLVTLLVPESICAISAATAPSEVMVRPYLSLAALSGEIEALGPDAVGIGPGLGRCEREEERGALLELLRGAAVPMVVDADALNLLADDLGEEGGPGPFRALRLLTPHPGELRRLAPGEPGERGEVTRRLADRWGVTLLHKGARTAVATPGFPLEFNTTGHPGMASGGMGDVLTGLASALVAQGLCLHDAACLGSWLLGRAAEIVRDEEGLDEISVTAPRVAGAIGRALAGLRSGDC